MPTPRATTPLITCLLSGLASCASVTHQPPTTIASPQPESILQEVIKHRESLGVCSFEFNPDTASSSQVYSNNQGQHLVQLLCFMAAYQGRFAFINVDTSQAEMKIQPLELEIVGFPEFNPQTNILSNTYKFIGAGTCTQDSQYYWDGYGLKLISSQIVDVITNGCQELGVRSPSPDKLITNKSVGIAQLRMTVGQLKKALGQDAIFQVTTLGVDNLLAMKVIQGGTLQYIITTINDQNMTDESTINSIIVNNPDYTTSVGIGAGTPLKQATAAYGTATLFYNTNNESREYIQFPQAPASQIQFRSNQWTITEFAGIYPDNNSEFQQTQKYHDHAAIGSITITSPKNGGTEASVPQLF